MPGDWKPLLKFPIGEKALANLLQTGWIKRSPDVNVGERYRITEAGADRLQNTSAHKVLKRQ